MAMNDVVETEWPPVEPSPPHLSYSLLSGFLIIFVLFSSFIRNRLHLSEPPLALLFGIIVGPKGLQWLTPNTCSVTRCLIDAASISSALPDDRIRLGGWGWGDPTMQEITRVIVGIQVFAVGVELPKHYMSRHWRSVAMLLGPIMAFGWVICALFVYLVFHTDVSTALVVAACLTPTDPVLAASILSNSQFSRRLPARIRLMLSAETGCNDGISFPFLYIGIFMLIKSDAASVAKSWFIVTIFWQCALGIVIGLLIGTIFNRILRLSADRELSDRAGSVVFYLLLAMLSVGIASTLGVDDFLVAFGAGYGFARDGWFAERTSETKLPSVIDLLLNSAMFVYFGTIIPWADFNPQPLLPYTTPVRLVGFLILVLLFRRIPAMLALYRWIPDIQTINEAWFCGHFGPMGLGGLFLAIEARAMLENGSSTPDVQPPLLRGPLSNRENAMAIIWPIVSFIVFGSTLVHGLSVLVLAIAFHFARPQEDRAALLAAENDPLQGMVYDDDNLDHEPEESDEEHERVQDELQRDQEQSSGSPQHLLDRP